MAATATKPLNITTILNLLGGPKRCECILERDASQPHESYVNPVHLCHAPEVKAREASLIASVVASTLMQATFKTSIMITVVPRMWFPHAIEYALQRLGAVDAETKLYDKGPFLVNAVVNQGTTSDTYYHYEITFNTDHKLYLFNCDDTVNHTLYKLIKGRTPVKRYTLMRDIYVTFGQKVQDLATMYDVSDVYIYGGEYAYPLAMMSMMISSQYVSCSTHVTTDRIVTSMTDCFATLEGAYRPYASTIAEMRHRAGTVSKHKRHIPVLAGIMLDCDDNVSLHYKRFEEIWSRIQRSELMISYLRTRDVADLFFSALKPNIPRFGNVLAFFDADAYIRRTEYEFDPDDIVRGLSTSPPLTAQVRKRVRVK